jgi:hypothetical protein
MSVDPVRNFIKLTLPGYHTLSDTLIGLNTGDGATLPNPSTEGDFNMVCYNDTDYPDPSDDPLKEIFRVIANSGDVLTVERAQEGTTATDKNIAGKTYKLILALTKKTIDDLRSPGTFQPIAITAGAQNGINKVFTLATAPVVGGAQLFFINGNKLVYGNSPKDYTTSGTTITFNTYAPVSADVLEFYANA